MSRKKAWLLGMLLLGAVTVLAPHASAVPMEFIVTGEFGTNAAPSLASWTVGAGATANARPSTNAINALGGNAGFNSFFSSGAFAVLGDASGAIGGSPAKGSHSISQTFALPSIAGGVPVSSWELTVRFVTAFDGKSFGAADTFSASLTGPAGAPGTLFSQDSSGFPSCLFFSGPATTCPDRQLTQSFDQAFAGLAPGSYTLTFTLVEQFKLLEQLVNIGTNTAAGIDRVSVTGEASVVPEPTTLLLWGTTLVGLGALARRVRRRALPDPRG